MGQWASFWEVDVRNADAIFRQAFTSHVLTAKYAAQRMIAARRGLIVEVTESDTLGAGGNPFSQAVKVALKAFALNMATELKPHRVAAAGRHAWISSFGIDARALRRHGGELARRRQEGLELPRVRVAVVRGARGRGARRGSQGAGAHRPAVELVAARARLRLHGRGRPTAGLGPARHRFRQRHARCSNTYARAASYSATGSRTSRATRGTC